ncbi:MAG: asparagine synthase-related protein, partial [Myxococcota bacterium]
PFGEAKPTSPDIRKLVEQAVASRMEADVPMGAFLSGGIDSSIVVGVMSKLKKEPVKTFSLGFADAPNYDETAYARLASAAFKTQHTEIKLGSNCWQHVEKLVTLYDGPVGDYSALPTYIVSGLAREQVSVALTGDGGDEIFCGYPRFIAGEWSESIPSSLLKIGLLLGGSPGPGKRTFIAQMRRFLSVASLPLAERMAAWSSYQTPQGEPLAWVKGMFESTEGLHPLARILSHNFESYLPEDLLVKADRCSMAHGLELRSPFLDTKLIEGATQLAPRALRRGRDTKIALKKAFEDILPAQILRRGKMGFGMPLGLWFRTDWASSLVELIGARQAKIYDYMDFNFGQKLLTSHLKGAQDNASLLWILMTLELWLLRK